jgi:hypothetical protein
MLTAAPQLVARNVQRNIFATFTQGSSDSPWAGALTAAPQLAEWLSSETLSIGQFDPAGHGLERNYVGVALFGKR